MKSSCISALFLLCCAIARADHYPINKQIDVLHYQFELSFHDYSSQLEGKATMRVKFKQGGADSLALDLIGKNAEGKGMVVDQTWIYGAETRFRHDKNRLIIYFLYPVKAGDTATLTVQYHGQPADGLNPGKNRTGDWGIFSDNWPNKTRHWLPTIDHPSDKASCEFLVRAPLKYQVVCNGLLKEQSVLNDSTLLTHWYQSVPIATWLYTIGLTSFAMENTGYFEGRPLQSWVYAKEREKGFKDLSTPTKEVLRYMTDLVGPFAYEKIANIESPVVGGGMEAASAIAYNEKLIDGKQSRRIRNVVIHELAHQWFGNAVTESTWDDVWLSESFATFYTLQFIKASYGKQAWAEEIKNAKKLFTDYLAKEAPYAIVSPRDPEEGEITKYPVTYQKGALVLTMLQDMIGEKAFREGARAYYAAHFNTNATTEDFISAMEKAAHRNLRPFFQQWLYRTDQIQASYQWSYRSGKLKVELKQKPMEEGIYVFPLELKIVLKDRVIYKTVMVDKAEMKLNIPVGSKPLDVFPDPDGKLLAVFQQ